MASTVLILLARLLMPVGLIVFAIAFYFSVRSMGQSERLFPTVMILALLLVAVWLVVREIRWFVVLKGKAGHSDKAMLDQDGLGTLGWRNASLVAGAGLIYLVALQRFGLIITGAVVYFICAATLIPDKSSKGQWIMAALTAIATGVIFDLAFRVGLDLPLPGL